MCMIILKVNIVTVLLGIESMLLFLSVSLMMLITNLLYQHLDHKGHDGLAKPPIVFFQETVIHKHSYYSYGSHRRECLTQVLEYLVGAIESEPHLTWPKQMHSLLQHRIHIAKRKQKQAIVFKSDTDSYHIRDALTIIESDRLQHRIVFATFG